MQFSQERIEQIKNEYPSLCYSCSLARRVNAKLAELGMVGCAIRAKHPSNITKFKTQIVCEDLHEGFVDLDNKVFGNGSQISTPYQYITEGVVKCKFYIKNL